MRKKLLSPAICFLFLVVPAHAAKRRFALEDLYRIRTGEDVHLSPDGRMTSIRRKSTR